MTREDAERKIRSVFTNYFQFAGDREADEVIEALKQKPSYQLASHNDNDEAKSVLFDMLGKGVYVKDTKENQAILVALRALEQDTKEIYNKGFADGQKAFAEHLKLCKEEQGWIPVSERLPELNRPLLVTAYHRVYYGHLISESGNYGYPVFRIHGLGDKNRDWVQETMSHEPYSLGRIDAWMYLDIPEPYKAESEVQDADK